MFKLQFTTENAAFEGGNDRAESARILARIVEYLGEGWDNGPIHDDNGNRIGEWSLEDNADFRPGAAQAKGV